MINIDELILNARKSKNTIELKAYQNIKSEIQKYQTSKGAKPLTEESLLQIISKYAKNLEDAILQFSEARREDLVSEYRSELKVVQKLLPEPVTERDVHFALRNWCAKNGFGNWLELPNYEEIKNPPTLSVTIDIVGGNKVIPKKEMGNAIKYLKSQFPTTDGKIISEIVKKYIL